MSDFAIKINKLSNAMNRLPNKLGAEAVLFSKDRFRSQNWVDNATKPWAKRKRETGGKQSHSRGVLIKSSRLMKSIRKTYVSRSLIIIGTDVPYAEANNEGFKGTVNVPAHKRKSRNGRVHTVKAHTVQMNMPQRQFLGNSQALANRLEKMILKDITNAIR